MKFKISLLSLLLITLILSCKFTHEPKVVISQSSQYYSVAVSDDLPPDAEVDSIISIYKLGVDSIMDEIIVISNENIFRSQPSGALNNLIADAMLLEISKVTEVHIDIALYNYYGIRHALPKGAVSLGRVFEILPFENQNTLVHLNPKGIKGMIDYIYNTGGQPLSGMNIKYIDSVSYEVEIAGEKLDTTKFYWVATSDYAANGGDNMSFFKDSDSIFYTGVLIRDNLIAYLKDINTNNETLEPDTLLRISFE